MEVEQEDSVAERICIINKEGTRSSMPSEYEDPVDEVSLDFLKKRKTKIRKNLAVLSMAFLLIFTGYSAIQNLQSSINKDHGLGTVSVSVIYGAIVVSCMFVPPLSIDAIGYKWTIVGGMSSYVAYMAANFYASWYTLIPFSVTLGLGGAPMWTAQAAYVTQISKQYGRFTKETDSAVIMRFFGIFFMIFQLSEVTGNAIASTVLIIPINQNVTTVHVIDDDVLAHCGADYCKDVSNNTNLKRPDDDQVYLLMGVFVCLGVLAISTILIFLDQVDHHTDTSDTEKRKQRCSPQLFVATFRHLRYFDQLIIIPLTLYSGLEHGFVSGDFTKSYVSCALGIRMVGFVMICFGVSNSLFSLLTGKVAKYIGRPACFWTGAALNASLQVALLLWKPHPSQLPVFFIIAALWGASDAIFGTLLNAFYGCVFNGDEQDAAFSNYSMWKAIGFGISFAYSSFICTDVKLYILLSSLIVGMLGYTVIEIRLYKNRHIEIYEP